MSRIKDLAGQRFGFWTIQSFAGTQPKTFRAKWVVKCDCGTTAIRSARMIQEGKSKSCGCGLYKPKQPIPRHGHFMKGKPSPEYRAWAGMMSRTRNPHNNRFYNYGARGITVCDRWKDFPNFLSDMGSKPSDIHSIERKDNSKGYEPSNCVWATPDVQNWNKRSTIKIEVDGQIKTLMECERDYGVKRTTIDRRLREGWDHERAAKTPLFAR
jgi:hypothetical protein